MTPDLIILVAFSEQQVQTEKSNRDARWQNNIACDNPASHLNDTHSLSREINDALESLKSWARHNLN